MLGLKIVYLVLGSFGVMVLHGLMYWVNGDKYDWSTELNNMYTSSSSFKLIILNTKHNL